MIFFPNCKINLGLRVLKRREDGFHEISTVMYPVRGLCDVLEIVPSSEFKFKQTGLKVDCPMEKNICFKAYELLKKDFNLPSVSIHLHKIVPMGAGLGGGSADGSYVLKGLNQIFELGLNTERLKDYASQLGSDTAFFIENKPCLARGRGELLMPKFLSLSGYYMVILKPKDMVSTAEAYSGVRPNEIMSEQEQTFDQKNIESWSKILVNDFENHIFENHPRIKFLKNYLYQRGAIYASMSGSGSAVYGIFSEPFTYASDLGEIFVYQELIR